MINAIVLCAGKSTRMKSETSKVLHKVIDRPLIEYIINTLKQLNCENIVLVVNKEIKENLENLYGNDKRIKFALQKEAKGTANAVMSAKSMLQDKKGETLILMGDCPLLEEQTLLNLIEKNKNYHLTFLTYYETKENAYGKIVRNRDNKVIKIVEHNEASALEKTIKEINTGVYCVKNEVLWKYAPYVDNEKNKHKFTDIVELLVNNQKSVQTIMLSNQNEFAGVNTREELVNVINILTKRIINKHLNNGVTIINPETVIIGPDVEIEKDVTIYPNNIIIGKTKIKQNCQIFSNCHLENCEIEENCTIESSKIINSKIGKNTTVGPFAHIKANAQIGNNNRIGAFVEVKNSKLQNNVKASHLAYLGDSEIGNNVNIGCGVITVNYDGKKKHKTIIGDNSFIGSNVNLIAPIKIGSNCVIAAGSTITDDVLDDDMAIARSYQINKTGYGKRYLNKNSD